MGWWGWEWRHPREGEGVLRDPARPCAAWHWTTVRLLGSTLGTQVSEMGVCVSPPAPRGSSGRCHCAPTLQSCKYAARATSLGLSVAIARAYESTWTFPRASNLSPPSLLQILAFPLGSRDMLKTRPRFQLRRQPCISPEYEVNLGCRQGVITVHSEVRAAPVTHPASALFLSIYRPTSWTLCDGSVVQQEGWTKFVYPETWQGM